MKIFQKPLEILKKNSLYIVVFITGACVLILEIVAIRVLSPYFGNTIYSFSSVITTILLALSAGYYFGGRLADKYPLEANFYKIIFVSSVGVFIIYILNFLLLPYLGSTLPLTYGPLVSSIILFLFPSFLLGMLSPYAIKLEKEKLKKTGIGQVSGNVFFASTLGSIFGSLLTGFVLIPKFGVSEIILGVGIVLIVIGISGMRSSGTKIQKFWLFTTITVVFTISLSIYLTQTRVINEGSLYFKDGIYEKIVILDITYENHPTRVIFQDKNFSGAMYLDSNDLVQEQSKYFELYKIFKPDTKKALVIGGASYTIPKALIDSNNDIYVDVAEIEPTNFEIAKKYFKVPDSPRLKNYITDGRRFLIDAKSSYDLIFGDAYFSFYTIPQHLTTKEFFKLSRDKLNDGGIFIGNFIGVLDKEPPSLLLSQMRTFRQVYPNSYFFAVENPDSDDVQNFIFIGYKSDKIIDFSKEEIKKSKNPLFQKLDERQLDISDFDLTRYQLLTDNYSPVEYLLSEVLQKVN